MTGGPQGPTRGAFEQPADRRWEASPRVALLIRVAVFASPVAGAFGGLFLVSPLLFRPPGWFGLALWFVQGLIVGTAISMSIERVARQLLPLASLFKMSLIFPDQAPSRFGVALRAGTMRRMADRPIAQGRKLALPDDPGAAAITAVEYMASLSRHDRRTRGHTERVRAYADLIGTELGLSSQDLQKLTWGVMLHDIGKLAVPAEILNKQGQLTADEWAVLKTHPAEAERLLEPLREWLGPWARAAGEHHERWDGEGYPRGLQGAEISLAGRITAVADAYDVITSARSYKEPMSAAAARRELVLCAGTQFDPDVVRAFLNVSLGRRWSAGVLAAASHLPIGHLGTTPAALAIGTVVTAGAVAFGATPAQPVETLAFGDEPTVIIEEVPETTEGSTTTSLVVATEPPSTETTTSSTAPQATTTSSSSTTTIPSSSTTSSTTPPTTAPTTAPPTTAPTTTAAPPSTPAPTTAPPTSPTTTSAPTTTAPPPGVLYLKNPGVGDTTARWNKALDPDGPDNATQPDYNTDEADGRPGSRFLPTSTSGFGEINTAKVEAFRMGVGGRTMSGPTRVVVWLATDTDLGGSPATVEADLASCSAIIVTLCSSIATASVDVTTWVGSGFQQVVLDFGAPSHAFSSNRDIVLRLVTRGSTAIHLAFDADPYPSRLETNLS